MNAMDESKSARPLDPAIRTILLQLERLRRNYYSALSTYDQISLFELSHSLRIWVDLKSILPNLAPLFGTKRVFKSAVPITKLKKVVKGRNFVIAYMAGGVTTFASQGQFLSAPGVPDGVDFSLAGISRINADGSLTLNGFWYAESVLTDTQMTWVGHPQISRYNYVDWMGAEAVRIWLPDNSRGSETLMISREVLINRIANTLDGSHPSAVPDPRTGSDKADPAIKLLLQYSLGGLPLPYFILLKIAADILDNAGDLLEIPNPKS